ncbi:MAG TPA: hypothetical protein VF135_06630 [Terriglobales bacterium]
MEYFILALINRAGLTSMYEFQHAAGLQPGGIAPAIRRLETLGFLSRGASSRRRRRELSVTPEGEQFLTSSFLQCLHDYPDLESVLRAACVALLMGKADFAGQYLDDLAERRRKSAEERSMDAERFGKTHRDPLSTYAWMRALCEAQRRGTESKTFSSLGQFLKEKHRPDGVNPG